MALDIAKYQHRLRELVPIESLSNEIQDELFAHAEILEFDRDKYVFREGDTDDYNYYLLDGELEMLNNGVMGSRYVGGSENARYPLAQLRPRKFSARVARPAIVFRVSRQRLDELRQRHASEGSGVIEVEEGGDSGDWMSSMLQSELFSRIPATNLQRLFAAVDYIEVQAGDEIITQGDPGDFYYIIHHGSCDVLVEPKSGGKQVKVASLNDDDSFGEEALVTNAPRNATIRMTSPGHLLRLGKGDFQSLIRDVLLESVSYDEAQRMVAAGAEWLDVRFSEDHEKVAIPDTLNIPFNVLRLRADELDPDVRYITYCNNGLRSSVAAFLLIQRGFDVRFLDMGLENSPFADELGAGAVNRSREKEVTPAPAPAPAPGPAATPVPDTSAAQDEAIDRLKTELAEARNQLAQMTRVKREADVSRRAFEKMVEQKFQLAKQRIRDEMTKAARALEESARLGRELEAARSEAAEGDKLRQLAEDHARQLEAQRTNLEAQFQEELNSARAEWNDKENRLVQETDAAQAELERLQADLNRVREEAEAELESVRGQAREAAEADHAALMSELTALKEQVDSLAEEKSGLEEEMERLTVSRDEEVERRGQERDDAVAALEALRGEADALREAKDDLERKVYELSQRGDEQDGQLARLTGERDAAGERIEALEAELGAVRGELEQDRESATAEKTTLAEERDSLSGRLEALEQELAAARAGGDEAARAAEERAEVAERALEEAGESWDEERAELASRRAGLEAELAAARAGTDEATRAAEERAEAAVQALEEARESWEEERKDLESELAETKTVLAEFDELRAGMENGRRAVEAAAERQEQELGTLEQTLRQEAEEALKLERERLEREFEDRLRRAKKEWQADIGVDTEGDVAEFLAQDDGSARLAAQLQDARKEAERLRDALKAVEKARDDAMERLRQARQSHATEEVPDDENRLVDPAKIRELMEHRRDLLKRQGKEKG